MPEAPSHRLAAAALCPDCGLCCNGVLFDLVQLQPGDQVKPLAARGLKVKRRQFFRQPCQALCGTRCTIYHDRPVRCREFECRQFQQVAGGGLPASEAFQMIARAKDLVVQVEQRLAGTAGDNRRKPLAHRVATALQAMPEGAESAALQQAMQGLQDLLADQFRVSPLPG